MSTAGILLISIFGEGAVSGRDIANRIFTFPPLIALAVALALMPAQYPSVAASVLSRLGALAPLALVSVGLQFRIGALRGNLTPLAMGVGYKLILGPLVIMLLYAEWLGLRGRTVQITLFEAGMGPMIGGSIVAVQYGLNAQLIPLVVGVGTALSFVTLPLWWEAFQLLGPP